MDNRGYSFCPVCNSPKVKKDKLYPHFKRSCEECQAEWEVETGNTRFTIIFNPRKEFFI